MQNVEPRRVSCIDLINCKKKQMKNFKIAPIALSLILSLVMSATMFAQGPPITSDKPIMLGKGQKVIKTLTEIRSGEAGTFVRAPIMFHYLTGANSLIGIHVPFVSASFTDGEISSGSGLGDVELLGKYQFYRKDGMGKTFRIVAKELLTLPTGKDWNLHKISNAEFQSYTAIVAGYESIKYGISNELGFNLSPKSRLNELRYKLGFGLPLRKPTYPANQINLYFEYNSSWFVQSNEYMLLYAQGLQYAKGQWTVEVAGQFPLISNVSSEKKRDLSLFLGTRYVF